MDTLTLTEFDREILADTEELHGALYQLRSAGLGMNELCMAWRSTHPPKRTGFIRAIKMWFKQLRSKNA